MAHKLQDRVVSHCRRAWRAVATPHFSVGPAQLLSSAIRRRWRFSWNFQYFNVHFRPKFITEVICLYKSTKFTTSFSVTVQYISYDSEITVICRPNYGRRGYRIYFITTLKVCNLINRTSWGKETHVIYKYSDAVTGHARCIRKVWYRIIYSFFVFISCEYITIVCNLVFKQIMANRNRMASVWNYCIYIIHEESIRKPRFRATRGQWPHSSLNSILKVI